MKKVTSKHIFLGILAVCVAGCLAVYLMVFDKYTTETETLKTSNDALETQVNEMKVYYDQMEANLADIARMTKTIADSTSDYQNKATEEDVVMMAVDMQNNATMLYGTINIDSAEDLLVVSEDVVKTAAVEGYEGEIVFTERQASYECSTVYAELKKCIDVIYANPNRVGIESVQFKKQSNDHNHIEGIITLSYFAVEGMNKPYEYPEMLEYTSGTEELFGKLIADEDGTEDEADTSEE